MTLIQVAGVDLSLTSTGIAVVTIDDDGTHRYVNRIQSKGGTGATLYDRRERLATITAAVMAVSGSNLIVIEGPSFGSVSGSQHDRSGLWWLVVNRLLHGGDTVVEVPPTCRTKYATGAGNLGKDAVLAAAVKRYPEWDITGNDVADAVILAAMGARHLGHPIDNLPQVHLSAMTKIHWPATIPGVSA